MTQLPDFASNWAPDDVTETVAGKVNELFQALRANKVEPPPIAIATAYINPGGFALLADELETAPRVRLLLGAEPEQDSVRAVTYADADFDDRISGAISQHEQWLLAERDVMGFERIPSLQAQRMVEWLNSVDADGAPKVEVRRYNGGFLHGKTYLVEDTTTPAAIAGSSNMTHAGLAQSAELNLGTSGGTHAARKVSEWFEHFWKLSDPYDLAGVYGQLWEPHEPWVIYLRMLWELYREHLDEDEDRKPHTNLGLTGFQAEGVSRMERLLDEHGGVLVADEVGLGKTYLAGEVIYRTTNLNRQRALIVAPAALKTAMWKPFLDNYDFSRWVEVFSYEEVRNRLDLERHSQSDVDAFESKLADYALVVIDEAHNLRNSSAQRSAAVDRVITAGGRPKKVVLLTATPVNNSLQDLENLIRYFIRDDSRFISLGIPSIHDYIKNAADMDPANLTPEHLFDLMDQVAVRRTRRFVKENYEGDLIEGADGTQQTIKFPQAKVRRIDYDLSTAGSDLVEAMVLALDDPTDPKSQAAWRDRVRDPNVLMLARYLSSMYTVDHDLQSYEVANSGLLRSSLLKRLESSPQALAASLVKLIHSHEVFLKAMEEGYVLRGEVLSGWVASDSDDLDEFLSSLDEEKLEKAQLVGDYHAPELKADVESDIELLRQLHSLAERVVEQSEPKVQRLIDELTEIAVDARRVDPRGVPPGDRRKVIVFSAFTDTIIPIHDAVTAAINSAPASSPLADYQGRVAPPIMGSYAKTHARGESGGVDQGGRASTIAGFAPETAGERADDGTPRSVDEYDILFATDVLAEGVNLQQAGQMINYDLPWNPMRIVQRHGRVDRIGSKHDYVHLGLFFPDEHLDQLLDLEARLVAKLQLADAAVGAGEVLPGHGPGNEINLFDDRPEEEIEEFLNSGGPSASLSGEEYRRRLSKAFESDARLAKRVKELPFGAGSGFESDEIVGNGYVFCIKLGKSSKPWFRFVSTDSDWNVALSEEGVPIIGKDTLLALRAADPRGPLCERWLTDHVYERAFDAWEVARKDAHEAWDTLTDPHKFEPELPKSFRDASALVINHGSHLDSKERKELIKRLKTVPTNRVALLVRRAINEGATPEEQIVLITEVLDDAGIVAQRPPEPLPYLKEHEVRLIAWMAVKGRDV